ncbi:unnamed protein product, partial [Ectocarpus sp. 8 AP-2014]
RSDTHLHRIATPPTYTVSLRGASSGRQDLTSPEYPLNTSPNRINSRILVPTMGGVNRRCDGWRCTAKHFLTREGQIRRAAFCSGRRRRYRDSFSRLPYFETRSLIYTSLAASLLSLVVDAGTIYTYTGENITNHRTCKLR